MNPLSAMFLPPMIGVADVQARYEILDARAARRVIRDAGGRKIAGRWLVRGDLLSTWEIGTSLPEALDKSHSPDRSITHARRSKALSPLKPGELLRPHRGG